MTQLTKDQEKALASPIDVGFLAETVKAGQETGLENMRPEDYAKPKLLLCQAGTPHRKKTADCYIQGAGRRPVLQRHHSGDLRPGDRGHPGPRRPSLQHGV